MAIVDNFFKIKKEFPEDLLMFKSGSFYHCYQNDAIIVGSLFNWNIKSGNVTNECGFPENSLNKVEAKLEELKINYKVLDPRNQYHEDEKQDFKNLNNYKKEFYKEVKINDQKKDAKKIYDRLLLYVGTNDFKPLIRKVEDLIDENGQV